MAASSSNPSRFPIGEGPFRIKGSGYVLHLQYVAEHVQGGTTRFLDALDGPKLRDFFAQPFIVGLWYDIVPLIEAGHCCAALTGTTFERFVRTRARHQFDGDLHMFRKLLLRLASPSMLATRIPPVVASYLDFTTCAVDSQKGERVTGTLLGVPRPTADWVRYVFEEFVQRALEVNGVTKSSMRWKPARCEPKQGITCEDWAYVIEWNVGPA